MKKPRYMQRLVVPILVVGMGLGSHRPAEASSMSVGPSGDSTTEPAASGSSDSSSPRQTNALDPVTQDDANTEGVAGQAESAPGSTTADVSSETIEAPVEPSVAPSPEPAEVKVITVQPRPIESSATGRKPLPPSSNDEMGEDSRRPLSDQRILLRASLLALGVAAGASVPVVIGVGRAGGARREIVRERDEPLTAAMRSDLEARERAGYQMALISGAVAVTGLVTGLVLLGTRRSLASESRQTQISASVGSGTTGVSVRGWF